MFVLTRTKLPHAIYPEAHFPESNVTETSFKIYEPSCYIGKTHFVQPTEHNLALSWLFRQLEQRDIN